MFGLILYNTEFSGFGLEDNYQPAYLNWQTSLTRGKYVFIACIIRMYGIKNDIQQLKKHRPRCFCSCFNVSFRLRKGSR